MTRFPDAARSRAILIGTSRFPKAPELPPIPAVRANLDVLRQILTDPVGGTITAELCQVVADPIGMEHLGGLLSTTGRGATDVLLVYYAGHGLLDDKGRLYLSLTDTEPDKLPYTALSLDTLREELSASPAAVRILILDCCFSGRAVEAMSDESSLITGQLDVAGTYTLTSTTANAPSHAPTGEPYTAFTGALFQAIAEPEPQTLDTLYQHVTRSLAARGLPRPQRRALNTAGGLALSRGGRAPEAPRAAASPEVRLHVDAAVHFRNRFWAVIGSAGCVALSGWPFIGALSKGSWGTAAACGVFSMFFLWLLGLFLFGAGKHPATLVINSEEIGLTVRVPWKDISQIGLMRWSASSTMRERDREQRMVLTVRLNPDALVPRQSIGLSRRHRELGYVGLCTLRSIGADRRSILEALAPFAGPRLLRTPADFRHADSRLSADMV